jgi:hypothetical protein
MSNTVSKHISILDYQSEWAEKNHINLSSLVQEKLDEEITNKDSDNKTEDEESNQ